MIVSIRFADPGVAWSVGTEVRIDNKVGVFVTVCDVGVCIVRGISVVSSVAVVNVVVCTLSVYILSVCNVIIGVVVVAGRVTRRKEEGVG